MACVLHYLLKKKQPLYEYLFNSLSFHSIEYTVIRQQVASAKIRTETRHHVVDGLFVCCLFEPHPILRAVPCGGFGSHDGSWLMVDGSWI